ncbi:MAG: hypothetical protein ACETWM_09525 [Candidatus Lokiarchaeia archaeon]
MKRLDNEQRGFIFASVDVLFAIILAGILLLSRIRSEKRKDKIVQKEAVEIKVGNPF